MAAWSQLQLWEQSSRKVPRTLLAVSDPQIDLQLHGIEVSSFIEVRRSLIDLPLAIGAEVAAAMVDADSAVGALTRARARARVVMGDEWFDSKAWAPADVKDPDSLRSMNDASVALDSLERKIAALEPKLKQLVTAALSV